MEATSSAGEGIIMASLEMEQTQIV